MSCRLCPLPRGEGEKIWDKLYLVEFAANYLRPSLFPLGSLYEFLIPIGLLFKL
jgi:hypothetical protein